MEALEQEPKVELSRPTEDSEIKNLQKIGFGDNIEVRDLQGLQ